MEELVSILEISCGNIKTFYLIPFSPYITLVEIARQLLE
jgi:hypothetical protein